MRFLDLRAAIRSLTQSPGFLTAAVLSLSVAIGASAAAFSVVDAVRFRTLPFPDGDRLVVLSERPESREGVACRSACDVSYETWANLLRPAPARSLDDVAAYTRGGKALNLGGEPILVFGGVVFVLFPLAFRPETYGKSGAGTLKCGCNSLLQLPASRVYSA